MDVISLQRYTLKHLKRRLSPNKAAANNERNDEGFIADHFPNEFLTCWRWQRHVSAVGHFLGAVICSEGCCDILRKWLFLFDQCSARASCDSTRDGDAAKEP